MIIPTDIIKKNSIIATTEFLISSGQKTLYRNSTLRSSIEKREERGGSPKKSCCLACWTD
jgi:hypothetical protein